MPESWPGLAGRISDGVHVLPIRVYYEDTDVSGAVYHANYLKFCERARSDCLRLSGVHHHRLEDRSFVVRRMVCDFLKPARIDDLLEVETRFGQLAGARLELVQRVGREDDTLFCAEVTVVLVDGRGRPRRISGALGKTLESLARSRP